MTIKPIPEDFPDWIDDDLADLLPDLNLVHDLWDGLRHGSIKKYIPKEQKEPVTAYENRVLLTQLDNLFTPTITGYSGLLSNFRVAENTAQSIVDNFTNFDGQGNDLTVFLTDGDNAVLRDGCCAYLVDFPDTSQLDLSTPLKLKAANLFPYVSLINRRNILNPKSFIENGKKVIESFVLRTSIAVPVGRFGQTFKTIYKLFERGIDRNGGNCTMTAFEIVEDKGTRSLLQIGDVKEFPSRKEIPIVFYSTNDRDPLKAIPPFLNTARLNIQLLRKQSQLDELLRKINMPVGVISDDDTYDIGPTGERIYKEIYIGCNTVIHTSSKGKFYFAEPTGAAMASTRDDINSLLKSMDRVSLSFLGGSKEGTMTATEALLNTAQVTTTISGIARRKESVVQSLFELWCSFTGEKSVGGITIDDSVIKPIMTDAGAQQLINSIGGLSPQLTLSILKERWYDFDVDDEISRRSQDDIKAGAKP